MAINKKSTTKKTIKKQVIKKTAPRKKTISAPKKAAPAKKSATKQQTHVGQAISPETRYKMISEAAYFSAEKENFKGDDVQHWLKAEADIYALLAK